MTPRRRRLVLVLGVLAGVAVAGGLALMALRENVMFFFSPRTSWLARRRSRSDSASAAWSSRAACIASQARWISILS